MVPITHWKRFYEIEGCIVNGYFLYKNRETRSAFKEGLKVHSYLDFEGIIMTDSGAFQGLTRQLFLSNRAIVEFQDMAGADIVSPLDLTTPPATTGQPRRRNRTPQHRGFVRRLAWCVMACSPGCSREGDFSTFAGGASKA